MHVLFFFFDTQKSPYLMMFYFWWKNFRFPWRGSKLQITGEQTLIHAWSSKDRTKDPFLNFFGFFFQFVVSLSGSIMPWNEGQMNFKTRPWPWSYGLLNYFNSILEVISFPFIFPYIRSIGVCSNLILSLRVKTLITNQSGLRITYVVLKDLLLV